VPAEPVPKSLPKKAGAGLKIVVRTVGGHVKRPTPDQIVEITSELAPDGETVTVPAVVAMIRERTGCSRATAYRGVADAMAAGAIRPVDPCTGSEALSSQCRKGVSGRISETRCRP
jgi:hypothetical protein